MAVRIALLWAALGSASAFVPVALADAPPTVDGFCQQLGERIRGFDPQQCRLAGLAPATLAKTVQGRPLLAREFAPVNESPANPPRRVLLLGGIHGDELSSVSVVFQWIEQLKTNRFQPYRWRVLPCANPDGLLAKPSRRVNAHGVDLNRNFPSPEWPLRALSYWKDKTRSDPRRYPGPEASSEPETRWIAEEIKSFRPDAIVSVHAPYGLLDFDGPRDPPKRLGYLRLSPLGVYPGSLGDYAGVAQKLPVITMELPQSDVSPSATQSGRIWADLLAWLDKNIAHAPAATASGAGSP